MTSIKRLLLHGFLRLEGQSSQSSVLLQLLEKLQAAEPRLPLSVLPQDQQVVGGAGDQTVLLEAHEHLKQTQLSKTLKKKTFVCFWRRPIDRFVPELPLSVRSGRLSAPASWCWGRPRFSWRADRPVCSTGRKSTSRRTLTSQTNTQHYLNFNLAQRLWSIVLY